MQIAKNLTENYTGFVILSISIVMEDRVTAVDSERLVTRITQRGAISPPINVSIVKVSNMVTPLANV